MKDRKAGRKAKNGLRVVHRNDQAAVRRWAQGSGQALLPMLELLENAQACCRRPKTEPLLRAVPIEN